jgi:hypothetical protein
VSLGVKFAVSAKLETAASVISVSAWKNCALCGSIWQFLAELDVCLLMIGTLFQCLITSGLLSEMPDAAFLQFEAVPLVYASISWLVQ